jgi:hypothetical protein
MTRRIYLALTIFCFALCAMLGAMAGRSFWRTDRAERYVADDGSFGQDAVYSVPGRIGYEGNRVNVSPPTAPASREDRAIHRRAQLLRQQRILQGLQWRFSTRAGGPMIPSDWLGFRFQFRSGAGPWRPVQLPMAEWRIEIPYWFLITLTGVPAIIFLIRARRLKPMGPGRCERCGYDLRATPERCPECGAVPEAAKGAAG